MLAGSLARAAGRLESSGRRKGEPKRGTFAHLAGHDATPICSTSCFEIVRPSCFRIALQRRIQVGKFLKIIVCLSSGTPCPCPDGNTQQDVVAAVFLTINIDRHLACMVLRIIHD